MENKIGKHEKIDIKPTWTTGNAPDEHYYFCGNCGNGLNGEETRCPVCNKGINWNGVPGK